MHLGSVIHRGCLICPYCSPPNRKEENYAKVSPEKSPTLSVCGSVLCVCHSWWKLIGGGGCLDVSVPLYCTVLTSGQYRICNLHKPATFTSLHLSLIICKSILLLQKVGNQWWPHRRQRIDAVPTEVGESMRPYRKYRTIPPHIRQGIDADPTEVRESVRPYRR